jgi:hypothetical protein
VAPAPPVGFVRIWTKDPPLEFTARLSDERPNLDSGFGGWDVVERPRRKPLTSWKSAPAVQLTLPLLFDAWLLADQVDAGKQIETAIAVVQKMGRPVASDGEPPQVRLTVRGDAIPYNGLIYVVSAIEWGDALMNEAGDRVRQFFTLSLTEYVEDVYLTEKSAANRRRNLSKSKKKKGGAKAKRVVAKRSSKARKKTTAHVARLAASPADDFGQGEDLLTIAARELGDADRWTEIAELNGLRDPRAIAPGQVLRLP